MTRRFGQATTTASIASGALWQVDPVRSQPPNSHLQKFLELREKDAGRLADSSYSDQASHAENAAHPY